MSNAKLFLLVFILPHIAQCVLLPGLAPVDYQEGDIIALKVNTLTSVHTQLPYKYYSLPFCKPDDVYDKVENFGEVLHGDRIGNSVYKVRIQSLLLSVVVFCCCSGLLLTCCCGGLLLTSEEKAAHS